MDLQSIFNWLALHDLLEPLSHLAKFGGFLLAGLVFGRLLRYPLAQWIEWLTPVDDHATSVRVAKSFERLNFFLVFAIVLNMGAIDVLHLPGWLWERARHLPKILLGIAVTMLFLQMVEVALIGLRKRWESARSGVDESLIGFVRKGIRIFVIIIAVLVTADSMEIKVTGAIAGLGIGGAALALAAQGLIANFLGTIEIVADRMFRVGDRIHFENFDGFVQEIGLRSTKIRALTGERLIVPNKKMAEVKLRNYSRDGLVRTDVIVGIVYSTSHDHVREATQVLDAILRERKDVDSHQIFLKNLGAYSMDLEAVFWASYTTSSEYNSLIGEINLEIKRRFDAAGIEFAFPTQTLHITQPKTG